MGSFIRQILSSESVSPNGFSGWTVSLTTEGECRLFALVSPVSFLLRSMMAVLIFIPVHRAIGEVLRALEASIYLGPLPADRLV